MQTPALENREQTQVTPQRLRQFAFAFAPPLLLETAVQYRIFDLLDPEPKTLAQLVQETHTSSRGLRAVLNALVGLEFLGKDTEGRYRLTPESAAFLVSSKPTFAGGYFRHISSRLLPPWTQLSEVVKTGNPVQAFNEQQAGTEFFQAFVEDLFPVNYTAALAVGEALQLSQAVEPIDVLDLAAGAGVWGIGLAQKSPQVHVTAVDWPGVLPVTRRVAARFGMEERFSYLPGDLLETDFGCGYQIATLGHILHSEGEERSRVLLQRTWEALVPGGTIVIAEWLVNPERTQPANGLVFAVQMLLNTEHGDTFSSVEISEWLQAAGFENIRMLENPGLSPLLLATKPDV